MTFFPSKWATIWTAALLLTTLAALKFPSARLASAAVLLAAMLAAARDYWRLRTSADDVKTVRRVSAIVPRGLPFLINLRIENVSAKNLRVQIREVLPAESSPSLWLQKIEIPAAGASEINYEIAIMQRGDYTIGATFFRREGWIIAAQWSMKNFTDVKVYPEIIAGRDEFAAERGAAKAEKSRQARERGAGMEFLTLSPFQNGDAIKHIDWRASARSRRLLARRYQVETHREVLILLDSGRLMGVDIGGGSKLDYAVNSALMLSEIAGLRGDKCGLGIFSDGVQTYLPPQNYGSAAKFAERLYSVRSEFRETDFLPMFSLVQSRQQKRALIIVMSDLVDPLAGVNFQAALRILARRHLVVFAALRSPQLRNLLASPLRDWQTVAEKAVVYRLEREREIALARLSGGGIEVLDLPPKELTAPLLNRYLRLRDGNRL